MSIAACREPYPDEWGHWCCEDEGHSGPHRTVGGTPWGPGSEHIHDLIERSSLGTPSTKAARASVSDLTAAHIVGMADGMADAAEMVREELAR